LKQVSTLSGLINMLLLSCEYSRRSDE
jgi:hypothetical protein